MFGLTDPNIFKVRIRFQIGQNQCETGFKLRDVATQDNTPATVSATVEPWAHTNFRTLLNSDDTLVAVDVLKMGTDEGHEHLFINEHGTRDDGAGALVPSFLAVNISMKTQLRKRYGQGRMFWPIRAESQVQQDSIAPGAIAGFQGVLDALTGLFTGDPITHDLILVNTHGILPPRAAHGSTPARPEIPASWYDVESFKVNLPLTSLRSRKVGIGA
jgi:hypothetical protein